MIARITLQITACIFSLLFSAPSWAQLHYYLKATGSPTSPSSWNSQPDGSGGSPTNLVGANVIWHFQVAGTRTTEAITYTLFTHGTSKIEVDNGFRLVITGAGYLRGTVNIPGTGTIVLQNNANLKLFSFGPNSTVVYNFPTTVKTPSLGSPYGNLQISTSAALSGTGLTVAGQVIIDAGRTLTLGGIPLRLTGQGSSGILSGTGAFVGGPLSVIEFSGGIAGNNGTLNLTPASRTLATLALRLSSAGSHITLGNDLAVVNGDFILHTGRIDLNGHDLRINADIEFPATANDGGFRGNQNSSLHLEPLNYFAGDELFFDPTANSLRALSLNTPSLSLTIGNSVVIHDSLSVIDGTMDANNNVFIESSNTLKGRIGRTRGTIIGDLSIRTFISGGATGWTLLGAPGVALDVLGSWDTYYTSNGANGIPMTCSNCFYQPNDIVPPFQSVLGWSESANDYDVNVNANTPLTPSKGFWMYVGDDDQTTSDLNVISTGAPVIGSPGAIALTANASGSDHWNLIANPLPSPISWTKLYNFVGNSSIDAQMQVYSPDHGYQTCTANGTCSHAQLSDVIAIGQGFYVNTTSSANLGFDESIKMDNTNVNIFRTAGKSEQQLVRLSLEGENTHDETVLNFHQESTFGFDRVYDANKWFTSLPLPGGKKLDFTTISTRDDDGVDYSINTMPELTDQVAIPVVTRAKTVGTYSIFVNEKLNYDGCLFLRDKLENKYHDLNAGAYVFKMADTEKTERFELVMCPAEGKSSVSIRELQANNNIQIGQNAEGAFVRTAFEQPTAATISVFNIVGQQLAKEISVNGTETFTQLPVNVSNQIIIIRVTTATETKTRKVVVR